MSAEVAEKTQLDRDTASRRRELTRADNELALAKAGIGPLQGEHIALQATVVNELKV